MMNYRIAYFKLYDFIDQCHPKKFNKLEKRKFTLSFIYTYNHRILRTAGQQRRNLMTMFSNVLISNQILARTLVYKTERSRAVLVS